MTHGSALRRGALALAAATVLVASACSSPGTTTASSAPSGAVFKRGDGGDLRILYWQAPTILNPHQGTGTKDNDASRLVIEPLAAFGPDGKPIANGLAEIPTVENGGVVADFSSVTWKLNPSVKWSDGTPFTADDVVFTWQYIADPATASPDLSTVEAVKSVEAVNATTVKVTYKAPNPNYYQFGVGPLQGMLQKAQFKDFTGAKAKDAPGNLKPIGTGPYVVSDFKTGDVVQYAMNPNYRDPNKPFFKTVTFKGGGDATSSARAVFQTGDSDYSWNLQVEPAIIHGLADNSTKGTLFTAYGSLVERILLQFADPNAAGDARGEPTTKHPFFSDIHVRRALAMATDRNTVAKELYGDGLTGKVTCNILAGVGDAESKNTAALDVCKFDPAAANKELDDAGWVKGSDGVRAKGGVKLKVIYQTTVNSVRQKTQEVMKKNWEAVGFSVELKSVNSGVFFTNGDPNGANHFWADVEEYANNSDPDATSYMLGWTSQHIAQKANSWNDTNYSRYANPAYDAIVAQLQKETDAKKRSDLFVQANDILVKDVVVIPLIWRTFATSGYAKDLKGVVPNGWDSEMWSIADWSK